MNGWLYVIAYIAMGLLGAGCETTKYVPVEVKAELPDRPPECDPKRDEAPPRMRPFPREEAAFWALCPGVDHAAACVNAVWSQHKVARDAVDRRNKARHQVCSKFLAGITRG